MTNQPSQEPVEPSPAPPPAPQPEHAPAAPAAPAQWPAAPPSSYPPAQYPPAPYQAGSKTSSNAIVALVLAVAAWVVCPIVPAIVSLVFASMAGKEIDASGDRIQGRGMVTAAKIVSWINIGFYVAVIVITGFVIVLIAIAGGMDTVKKY